MSVSMLGDGVFWVSLGWQVYDLSDSPTTLSLVGIAWTLPMVLLLLAGGLLSDRMERRKVMILADAIRGVAVAGMGILSLTGAIEIWHLILLTALFGIGDAFFGPAFTAIVPDIVPTNLIVQANALDNFVRPVALMMLGPAIGGLAIKFIGLGAAFLFDAATFAFSAFMLLAISRRPVVTTEAITWKSARSETKEGFAYVRSQPWLWATLLSAGLTLLAIIGPIEVVLPHLVKYELGGDAGDLGVIYAMGGVGAVIAALVIGQRGLPRRHITIMYLLWGLGDGALAAYAFAGSLRSAMAIQFVTGGAGAAALIIWGSLLHRLVPRDLLSRVSSFDWLISVSLIPLSFAITGPLANAIGDDATMFWSGMIAIVFTLGFLFFPGVRETEGTLSAPGAPSGESDAVL
jgi:hypothetical protein